MRFPGKKEPKPTVDLHTVFETLSYMHDDLARDPDLKSVADAMDQALKEISRVRRSAVDSAPQWGHPMAGSLKPHTARFLANRKR